jgi:hypothetical protein
MRRQTPASLLQNMKMMDTLPPRLAASVAAAMRDLVKQKGIF